MANVITIPAAHLAAAALLAPFTAPAKENTPILECIAIDVHNGAFRAIATDRYTIAEVRASLPEATVDFERIAIHAKELGTIVKRFTITPPHEIGIETGSLIDYITFRQYSNVSTAPNQIRDGRTYPPVDRLLDAEVGDMHGTPLLRPDFLARLTKLKDPTARPAKMPPAWRFQQQGDGAKPGPVLATAQFGVYAYRVLIQPNRDPRS